MIAYRYAEQIFLLGNITKDMTVMTNAFYAMDVRRQERAVSAQWLSLLAKSQLRKTRGGQTNKQTNKQQVRCSIGAIDPK